jgi:hypothetical protein
VGNSVTILLAMSDGTVAGIASKAFQQRQKIGLTPDGIGGNATLFQIINKSRVHGMKPSVGTTEAATKPLRTVMKSSQGSFLRSGFTRANRNVK